MFDNNWIDIAIEWINDMIDYIRIYHSTARRICPVCNFVKSTYGIRPGINTPGGCTDDKDNECPAKIMCNKYSKIIHPYEYPSSYTPVKIRSKIIQFNEHIRELEMLK